MDEGTFLYCEESILASQVKKYKYSELFISNIIANHEHYEKNKQGRKGNKMRAMLESRIYWIKKYSDYSNIQKFFLVSSKKFQILFWKLF